MVGCKSPTYTAGTKSDLAKLCVYEFPASPIPLKTTRDTIVFTTIKHVRDSIDCTDKVGYQEVLSEVPCLEVEITETNTVQDASKDWYIKDLEFSLEKAENTTLKEIKAHRKTKYRMLGIILLLGGFIAFKMLKI